MNNASVYLREFTDPLGATLSHRAPPDEASVARVELTHTINRACARIAPLWPLKHFVAVNPFLGLTDRSFGDACELIHRTNEGGMLMSPSFYRGELARGRITDDDLQHALHLCKNPFPGCGDPTSVRQVLEYLHAGDDDPTNLPIPTIADWLDRSRGTSVARLIIEEVAKWCGAYYDEGQSAWRLPWRSLPLFSAWKRAAALDRNPELSGISGFRAYVARLPDDPLVAIRHILARWAIDPGAIEDLLHRQLMTIAGWAGVVQYRVREKAMRGEEDDSLMQLLAIRLAYDDALFAALGHEERHAFRSDVAKPPSVTTVVRIRVLTVLQTAFEAAIQRELIHL